MSTILLILPGCLQKQASSDAVSINREELVPIRVVVSMTLKSSPRKFIRNSAPEGTDSVIAELRRGGAGGKTSM